MSDAPAGDPVCWIGRLCPECGAMPSGEQPSSEQPDRCWRCDHAFTDPPSQGRTG